MSGLSVADHLAQHGYEVVTPTPRLIRYWWVRCLKEVFGYPAIRPLVPLTIEVRRQPTEWAACQWPDKDEFSRLHLTHHNEPISRYGLLTVILHEIVHAILVHEERSDSSLHGERFMAYAELVESETGLPLKARYSYGDILALRQKINVPRKKQ